MNIFPDNIDKEAGLLGSALEGVGKVGLGVGKAGTGYGKAMIKSQGKLWGGIGIAMTPMMVKDGLGKTVDNMKKVDNGIEDLNKVSYEQNNGFEKKPFQQRNNGFNQRPYGQKDNRRMNTFTPKPQMSAFEENIVPIVIGTGLTAAAIARGVQTGNPLAAVEDVRDGLIEAGKKIPSKFLGKKSLFKVFGGAAKKANKEFSKYKGKIVPNLTNDGAAYHSYMSNGQKDAINYMIDKRMTENASAIKSLADDAINEHDGTKPFLRALTTGVGAATGFGATNLLIHILGDKHLKKRNADPVIQKSYSKDVRDLKFRDLNTIPMRELMNPSGGGRNGQSKFSQKNDNRGAEKRRPNSYNGQRTEFSTWEKR